MRPRVRHEPERARKEGASRILEDSLKPNAICAIRSVGRACKDGSPNCRPPSDIRGWAAEIKRVKGATHILFFHNVASSSPSGIARARRCWLSCCRFPIHLFKDLLVEQLGFAPALAVPRPGMSPN